MGGVYNSLNLNPYAYAHHNPVKYVDPDGEWPRIVRWLGNSPLGRWLANTPVGKKTIKGFKKFNKGVDKALQSTWEGAKALWRWAGDKLSGSNIVRTNIDNYSKAKIDNKTIHLFKKADHNLTPLLNKFGGDKVKVFKSIFKATQNYIIKNPGVVKDNKLFEVTIKVKDVMLTVRGNIHNRAVEIGTAFIKNKK